MFTKITFIFTILFQSIYYIVSLMAEVLSGYIADIFSRKEILLFYIGRSIV